MCKLAKKERQSEQSELLKNVTIEHKSPHIFITISQQSKIYICAFAYGVRRCSPSMIKTIFHCRLMWLLKQRMAKGGENANARSVCNKIS